MTRVAEVVATAQRVGDDVRRRPRLADHVLAAVSAEGCDVVFGLPGDSVNCLLDAVRRRDGFTYVGARHEAAAALMASGYARARQTVGLCFGTNGPGATHLLAGLWAAEPDGAPVVALSGTAPIGELGTRSFQETDPAWLFASTGFGQRILDVSRWPAFDEALAWALTHRRPAHVGVTPEALRAVLPGPVGGGRGGRGRPTRIPLAGATTWVARPGARLGSRRPRGALALDVSGPDPSPLPIGIGAALGLPETQVWCVAEPGDEEYAAELLTARDQGVDLVVLAEAGRNPVVEAVAVGAGIDVLRTRARPSVASQRGRRGPVLVVVGEAPPSPAPARPRAGSAPVVCVSRRAWTAAPALADHGLAPHPFPTAESALMAASGAAKATGRPGVAVVGDDHDLLRGINGLCDATYDGAALVVAVLDGPTPGLAPTFAPLVDPEPADGASGPAAGERVLRRVLVHEATPERIDAALAALAVVPAGRGAEAASVPASVVDLIASASALTLLVGAGAAGAVDEVRALADGLGAAVVTTMGAPAIDGVEGFAGHFGASGHASAARAVAGADVLVRLGCSRRGSPFGLPTARTVVDVNLDVQHHDAQRAGGLRIGVRCDVAAFAEQVLAHVDEEHPARRRFGADAASRYDRERAHLARPTSRRPVSPSRAAWIAGVAAAAVDADVTVDVGLVTLWAFRCAVASNRRIFARSFASMGFAVPGALGASLGSGRPAVALVGDGALLMGLASLRALADAEEPIAVVVFDNGRLGAITFEMESMGWHPHGEEIPSVDIVETVRALGVRARRIESEAEIAVALAEALAAPGATVLDVVVDPGELPAPAALDPGTSLAYALSVVRQAVESPTRFVHERGHISSELRFAVDRTLATVTSLASLRRPW